jgi:hypothetical protein
MKNPATYEDANLILKLYDLRREPRLRDARKFVGALPVLGTREDFLRLCPPGTEENASFRMVVTYWDMASSFIVTGILNKELFFRANNLELVFVWERIRRALPELRAASKNPTQYRHLEQIGDEFIAWMNENAPEWYATFAAGLKKA